MKVTTDSSGRLEADLFRPNAVFEVSRLADGAFRVAESAEAPVLKPRRINGRLRGAAVNLSRETVAGAVRAARDER
jgi:hypothetical protein